MPSTHSSTQFRFRLLHQDATSSARRSVFDTPRGSVQLPAFMPVGTQGTVKGVTSAQLAETGAEMILANTYHLALRPGEAVVARLGGLHNFCKWPGPMLTDSGGFQVFSLADRCKVTEEGAEFRSHIDGSLVQLTPERCIAIQAALGSDVAMVLDHVVALPATSSDVKDACERSIRWARRCLAASQQPQQALFAIVQGGLDEGLRRACSEQLSRESFDGLAIGGLSVGEPPAEMYRVLDITCPMLPSDRPRYLMGVGRPEDLLQGVLRGVDLFDCVMPTRNGRNALAFTNGGAVRLRNEKHRTDTSPLDPDCPCAACRHSRGYLRHLFLAKEMLGPILVSIHNLTFYQRLMAEAREAIQQDRFATFVDEKTMRWRQLS